VAASRYVLWQPERPWVCPVSVILDPNAPPWLAQVVDLATQEISVATKQRITFKRGASAPGIWLLWQAPPAPYIGYTMLTPSPDGKHWGAAQIELDPVHLSVNPMWRLPLVLHEMLHACGLGHSDKPNDIMDSVLQLIPAITPDTQAALNQLVTDCYPAPVMPKPKPQPETVLITNRTGR
jgi:hypothetical protein